MRPRPHQTKFVKNYSTGVTFSRRTWTDRYVDKLFTLLYFLPGRVNFYSLEFIWHIYNRNIAASDYQVSATTNRGAGEGEKEKKKEEE